MIADLISRFIAGPIARLIALIPYEPVVIFGIAAEILVALNAELEKGVTLQHALTAVIIAFGTRIVRQNVWPAVKVDADGVAYTELEQPLTGVPEWDDH